MEVKCTIDNLTQEELCDFLSCALSGSFWAGVNYSKELQEQHDSIKEDGDCLEDILSKWLLKAPENTIIIYDIEEEDKEYPITLKDIQTAWGNVITKHNGNYPSLDEMDLFDADAILQTACFGEVIYG